MLAYGILDESEELVLMTIEALIQLAAGNAGVNVANVGISSFAILTAVAYPIASHLHGASEGAYPKSEMVKPAAVRCRGARPAGWPRPS